MAKRAFNLLAAITLIFFLNACGGDSSDSGMLIEGSLKEGAGVEHSKHIFLKHSAGESIENVQVCALERCAITDAQGQWGFVVGDSFTGGEVLFSVIGHGIDTSLTIDIPQNAKEVFLDLLHDGDGEVQVQHITADGETHHLEN